MEDKTKMHKRRERKESTETSSYENRALKTDLTILAWRNEPIINLWMRGFGSF